MKDNKIPNNDLLNDFEESDLLKSLINKNSFKVPDQYFDVLESEILKQTVEQKPTITISLSGKIRNYKYLAYAASIIFILGLAFLFIINSSPQKLQYTKKDSQKLPESIQQLPFADSNKTNVAASKSVETENEKETHSIPVVTPKAGSVDFSTKKMNPQYANSTVATQALKETTDQKWSPVNSSQSGQNIALQPVFIAMESGAQTPNYIVNSTDHIQTQTLARLVKSNRFIPSDTCVSSGFNFTIAKRVKDTYRFVWNNEIEASTYHISEGQVLKLEIFIKDSLIKTEFSNITWVEKPQPEIPAFISICAYESVLIDAKISQKEYHFDWSVSTKNSSELLMENLPIGITDVKLRVTSCADTVWAFSKIEVKDCKFEIPNVITPNGDGFNDYFVIKGLNNYPGTELTVFDRNGKLIYHAPDYQNDWSPANLPEGTYFYSLKIKDSKQTEHGGVLNIVR